MAEDELRTSIRNVPLGSLTPIDATDEELIATVDTPEKENFVTVNAHSGVLYDGNGRVWELLRRADDAQRSISRDLLIPVQEYIPDYSMFGDLP